MNNMMQEDFYLEGHPHVALNDLLKMSGIAETGGRAKMLVAEGLILVDGAIELRKTAKILAGSKVTGDLGGQHFEITVKDGYPE